MPSLFTLLTLPLVIPSILAGVIVQRADPESRTGRFIVRTKPTNGEASIASVANTVDPESITNHYNNVFSGFAGTFSESELESLRNDPNVESIIEDVTFSINSIVTQTDAPWGLERISHIPTIVQHSDPLTYNYTRDDSEGAGVDVYVVDTGINVNHVQFQGRAKLGWAGSGLGDGSDDQGHGTHVAGTIGSLQFGVAKKTALIAVKVLSSTGEGSGSDLVSGLDWVAGEARTSGKPSVVNLSLGFSGVFTPADDAVKRLVEAGVHVVVAAGNDNVLTTGSPAHVPEVITVGAVDINDEKADFSNFGPVIDINAPGVDILSTSFSSNTGIVSMSGTSMACPHVAGLVAYFVGLHGNMSPAAMSDFIKEKSIKGALKNLVGETPNNLAYNGVSSTLTRRHQVMRKDVRSGASWARRDRFAKRQAA